jgi:homoserine acetyltransferase
MKAIFSALAILATVAGANAQELITKKQVFQIDQFTTQSGRSLKAVKVGWESYGTLNADKSNAILICHYFSGNSHAAGKYAPADKTPGYWDAIIGPGKAIEDQVFPRASIEATAKALTDRGVKVKTAELHGDRGHLDGVLSIQQAADTIASFLAEAQ